MKKILKKGISKSKESQLQFCIVLFALFGMHVQGILFIDCSYVLVKLVGLNRFHSDLIAHIARVFRFAIISFSFV